MWRCSFSSLAGLIAAALVSGVGQGISFSRGLAAVAEHTPAQRRAEVSSTYFVVAYIAISMPVIGEGLAAQRLGLRTSGIVFAARSGVLALACLAAILWQGSRQKPEYGSGSTLSAAKSNYAALAAELPAVLQRSVRAGLFGAAVLVCGTAGRLRLLALQRLTELALGVVLRIGL